MSKKYDGSYKKLFTNPLLVEDLMHAFVKTSWVSTLDFQTLQEVNSSFISNDLERREGDLIFSIQTFNGEPAYLFLLLEFQSSQDHWMALRFLVYVDLLYQDLVKQKQVTKKGLLPPVFPVLLYNGSSKWRAQTDLKALIELPKKQSLWPFQPKISYYLIDEKEAVQGPTDGVSLSRMLFEIEQSVNNEKALEQILALVNRLDNPKYKQLQKDFLIWIQHVFEPVKQMELDLGHIESIKEVKSMLQDRVEQWKVELVQQGIEQGIEQGIGQGEVLLLLKLLAHKFGPLSPEDEHKVKSASSLELEAFSLNLMTAASLEDVFKIVF